MTATERLSGGGGVERVSRAIERERAATRARRRRTRARPVAARERDESSEKDAPRRVELC